MKGSRTYIIAGLIGVATAIKYLGYIDQSIYELLIGLLAGGGVATMRAALPPTE